MLLAGWVVGLLFSLLVGHFAVSWLLNLLRNWMRIEKPKDYSGTRTVPPWLIGFFERLFFTVAVGVIGPNDLAEIITAMMAWLGIKLAANWNRESRDDGISRKDRLVIIRLSLSATLAGLVSMTIAMLGGFIIKYRAIWYVPVIGYFCAT